MKLVPCLRSLLAPAACFALAATASAQLHQTDATAVGSGWIRTYVEYTAGAPTRLGVRFDSAALSTLSSGAGSMTKLALPTEAPAPYNHVSVDWNPSGHPGPGYDAPHFDFHFYFETPEVVAGIPFNPAPPPVSPLFVAPGYVGDPIVVPQMGQHFLDSLSPEFGDPAAFTQTLIYGYHDGKMSFIEPMITLATLQAGGTHTLPVRAPAYVQTAGYYPTDYGFTVENGVYDVFLTGLHERAFVPVPEPATWAGGIALSLLVVGASARRLRQRSASASAG
ncbi:DUF5602 domain-containing protein [Opitutus terrae]|uniref:TTHB210-like domain-containing protein n=1 Tax=Opitutus terrae (strain DSM 11246 / JCM 15787 / PB90-1) TaxID=452637 RepID=B1ZML3_OPITP|nr:DUF5602 domain-containing protein [Opitutus terrae]ACB74358.1 hypothetical protein Oter_1070 [Opitutus terrae PB90-1]